MPRTRLDRRDWTQADGGPAGLFRPCRRRRAQTAPDARRSPALPYGFGDTRVAVLALLTFIAALGIGFGRRRFARFSGHAVTFRSPQRNAHDESTTKPPYLGKLRPSQQPTTDSPVVTKDGIPLLTEYCDKHAAVAYTAGGENPMVGFARGAVDVTDERMRAIAARMREAAMKVGPTSTLWDVVFDNEELGRDG